MSFKSRFYAVLVLLTAGAVVYPDPVKTLVIFHVLARIPPFRAAIYMGGLLGSIYCC